MPKTFTLNEQIGCIDRQIGFQERVIAVFENDDPKEIARAKDELECLRSIRETIQDAATTLTPVYRKKNRIEKKQYV